ncbi:hypothetical protein Vafri_2862 [Volvox africanus]|uniref:Alfin N-terminal domain-containing protein n=1 Tax=Volvox africanus TaxID=51714 RepID=A0A8J4AQH7_9CHLO|nr:hypothetical protein Vafri_2862 [Volvox africanus]
MRTISADARQYYGHLHKMSRNSGISATLRGRTCVCMDTTMGPGLWTFLQRKFHRRLLSLPWYVRPGAPTAFPMATGGSRCIIILSDRVVAVQGINFARDGMERSAWISLVAVHSDSWLLALAFYKGARLNREEREELFSLINKLPTCYEVVSGRVKPSMGGPTTNVGGLKRPGGGQSRTAPARAARHSDDDGEDAAG